MELDSNRIARRFLKSLETYEEGARVQREVVQKLMLLLDSQDAVRYQRVLEIGCGTGRLTAEVCARKSVARLYLNDLVEDFCKKAANRVLLYGTDAIPLPGNIEKVCLPPDLDLILSASTLQWLTNLSGLFTSCADALAPGGFLVFSLFGPGTMQEIRELLGVGLNYRSHEQILANLDKHFICHSAHQDLYQPYFETPRQILRHIQQTGVGGVAPYRWTRSRLREFESRYIAAFGDEKGVPLTYHALSFVAQKKN